MSLESEVKKLNGHLEAIAIALQHLVEVQVATQRPVDTAERPVLQDNTPQVTLPADAEPEAGPPITTDELAGFNQWLGEVEGWLTGIGQDGAGRIRAAINSTGLNSLEEIGNSRAKLSAVGAAVQAVVDEVSGAQAAA